MIKNWKSYALAGGALLFLASLGWLITHRGPLAPITVVTASVEQGDLRASISGIGTVEARLSYTIGPTQGGRLLKVMVDQWDLVKAGQVLAEMDPVDFEQRIRATESAAQRAQQSVWIATAQEKEAQSRYRLAQANASRYKALVAKNFVSNEMAESRQNEAQIAEAALEAARSGVVAARKDAEKAVAERAGLLKQRDNLKLVSNADGLVVSRDAEPGTTVVAGQAVFHLVDPDSLWVRARVDQAQARGVAKGQSAQIVLRSSQNETLAGQVTRIEMQSDSVTEERVINVSFVHPPKRLYLGELAEVTIQQENAKDVLNVPSAAVKKQDSQTGVWQITEGKSKFVPVQVGIQTLDGKAQLKNGLKKGDKVIVYSSAQLREGMKVREQQSSD